MDAKTKRAITRQWHANFPGFTVWRPGCLLRRIGPVLQGITLDRTSTPTEYYATAHIHALTKPFPVVSLTMSHRLSRPGPHAYQSRIWVHDDSAQLAADAAGLRAQSPLSLDEPPTVDEIVAALRRWLDTDPYSVLAWGPMPELEDLVLISAYASESALEYARGLSRKWRLPPEGWASQEDWVRDLAARAADRATLDHVVEAQARALKVDRIGP